MKSISILLFTLIIANVYGQVQQVNTPYERGTIKDNNMVGIWEFYDKPGELSLKVDLSSNQLLYIKPDSSEFTVKIGNTWSQLKLDRYPRFLGSFNEILQTMGTNIKYPREALEGRISGKFYVSFEVDTLGAAGNFEVINDICKDCGQSAIQSLLLVPNVWLVAQKGNKKYVSRFVVPVTFKMSDNNGKDVGKKQKEKPGQQPPLGKYLEEVVVIAHVGSR